jgi:glycosyltransferase involved in cell wall biosynthesis
MNIVFDGYWWTSGPYSNRTVLVNIVHEWNRLHPEDNIIVVYPGKKFSSIKNSKIKCIQVPWLPHPLFNVVYISTLRILYSYDYSISQNFALFSRRNLVFIHDFIFLERKEWFSKLELIYFSFMPRFANNRRTVIVTSSTTEGMRIESHLKLKKVTPVGLGVRLALTEATATQPKNIDCSQGKFYFTIGRNNPRKNLARLLQAHIEACEEDVNFLDLIVVGVLPDEVQKMGINTNSAGKLIFLNNLSDSELRWLYEYGEFTVFLSLDEGFGLPMKEAEFFEIPQLVSDLPVFREVANESAHFVNPISVDQIKEHLILLSKNKRQKSNTNHKKNNTWVPVIYNIRKEFKNLGNINK